ncbi:MAG: 23S rRNA (guanosine(2251)-2'-O)-methyltransferase RlmB [bacterium]
MPVHPPDPSGGPRQGHGKAVRAAAADEKRSAARGGRKTGTRARTRPTRWGSKPWEKSRGTRPASKHAARARTENTADERRPASPRPEDTEAGHQLWIYGVQPVLETLRQEAPGIEKIWIAYGRSGPPVRKLLSLAREHKIPVSFRDRSSLDSKARTAKHQGVVALTAAASSEDFDAFWESLPGRARRFLTLLDEIQDPHNLGAILRTACAAGLEGVLLPRERTSPVSPVVIKASAGTARSVRLIRLGSAVRTLQALRERGVRIVGADPGAGRKIYEIDLRTDLCLVVGGEKGLRPALQSLCDVLVSIPMSGQVESLNASVAAAILFYEVVRQRTELPPRS